MKAGPALDRLVAEAIGVYVRKQAGRDLWDLFIPFGVNQVDFATQDGPWSACPKYSTDIAAAASLLKCYRLGILPAHQDGVWVIGWEGPGACNWFENWTHGRCDTCVEAVSIPLGICAAVLKLKVKKK